MFSKFITSAALPRRASSASALISSSRQQESNSSTILFTAPRKGMEDKQHSIQSTSHSPSSSSSKLLSSFRACQPLAVALSSSDSGLSMLMMSPNLQKRQQQEEENHHQQQQQLQNGKIVVDQLLEQISKQLYSVEITNQNFQHNNNNLSNQHHSSELYTLCEKIIVLSQSQQISSTTDLFLSPSLEALVRKMIFVREQTKPHSNNNNNHNSSCDVDDDEQILSDLFNLVFENQPQLQNGNNQKNVALSLKQSFSLIKSIAIGILSSKLATADDVLLVLRKIRTFFTSSDEDNSERNTNNNNNFKNYNFASLLTDQDRNELFKVVHLAKERIEEIIISDEATENQIHQQQYTIIQCFHSLFPLILHGPFSESTNLLQQISCIFNSFVLALGVMIIPIRSNNSSHEHLHKILAVISTSKQVCYVVSVLARRPSSSTETSKAILLSVLHNEAKFSLIVAPPASASSASSSSSSSSIEKIHQQLSAAISHSLLAFYVLNEPQLLLNFVASNNTNHQTHWTVAWALAHTNQIGKSLSVLLSVATSRPNGWTGVPARIRNVFTSVGSKLETADQVREWCRVIAEMKCPSMRADAANIVAALLEIETLSPRNQEAILEMAKIVAASSGLFQSDASKVINHFLVSVKNIELTMQEQEKLVGDVVSIWRDVVVVNNNNNNTKNSKGNQDGAVVIPQLQHLDSRLLETLFFDHAHNNIASTATMASSIPFWISHVARYPILLLPGALPKHLAVTLQTKIESAFKNNAKNSATSIVSALYHFSLSMNKTINFGDAENDTNNKNFVWNCQLCDTSNTYIHSTCGNDSCKAARFPPLQCNSCLFLNPSNASECHVCSNASSFTPRPFGKWVCSACGEREHNVPTSSVMSGIRCVKCSKMTGPLVENIDFKSQTSSGSKRICTNCQETPREGDVFSSQNPSCTSKICSSASCCVPSGTLLPQNSNDEISRNKFLSTFLHKDWTCLMCHEKNQFWRERCAKCLQVCRSVPTVVGDGNQEITARGKIHSMMTSEASGGLWTCACGCQSNSTVFDHLCTLCGGSMELNCRHLTILSSKQRQELKANLIKELELKSKTSQQTKLLTVDDVEKLSSCSVCHQKQSQQQYLGDFCKNPNCGSALPMYDVLHDEVGQVSKSIKILFSNNQQQQQLENNNNAAKTSEIETMEKKREEDPVVSALIVSAQKQKTALSSSSSSPELFSVSSPSFYLNSLRNNLEHLLSLISYSNLDSKVETNVLQKQQKDDDDDNDEIDNNKRKEINGLAHRLIRLCAERCVLLQNIYRKSMMAANNGEPPVSNLLLESLIDAFQKEKQHQLFSSSSSNLASPFQEQLIQLRRLSIELSSVASQRWNVMSDSFIRGSLAASVKIVMSILEISASSAKSCINNNNNANLLPPKIKFLLHDEGRCKWCLGRHPESMCPKNEDLKDFSPTWCCAECGEVANDVREGAQRYVCKSCLGIRPEVVQMEDDSAWAEVWECPECRRATPTIEDNCIFCPYIVKKKEDEEEIVLRRQDAVSSVKKSNFNANDENSDSNQYDDEDFMSEETMVNAENKSSNDACSSKVSIRDSEKNRASSSSSSSWVATTLPFFPARCGLCGEVHFEALCPICSSGDVLKTEVRNAFGVVNRIYAARKQKKIETSTPVADRNKKNNENYDDDFVVATVQPHGTAGKNSLVLVPLSILPKDGSCRISVGSFVRFDAQRSSVRIQSPSLIMSEGSQRNDGGAQQRQVVNFQQMQQGRDSTALCATSITIV